MKIEIQQYKGQTIEYDDENDKFVCDITLEDRTKSTKRQSLKDVRREIDSFVKANLEFKPFKLFEKKSYSNNVDIINVNGIRTDGLFVCRQPKYSNRVDLINFEKEIKDGDQYFEYDSEYEKKKKKIDEERKVFDKIIDDKEKELFKTLKKFDLKEVKKYTDAFKKN